MRSLYIIMIFCFGTMSIYARCELPDSIKRLEAKEPSAILGSSDIQRNSSILKKLCVNAISFHEGRYHWKMILVTNPKHPKGAFWFLPHDNENAAFDAAVYAVSRYGGGFLSVVSGGSRYFNGQDPNRNFGTTTETAKICKGQKSPAPKYSKNVFKIIDTYRAPGMPYLALHNNKNGWYGNGGSGGVSILKSTKTVRSYPAYRGIDKISRGLLDEDNLVYIAGEKSNPNRAKLNRLLNAGLNVKYEIVSSRANDCSMSNYVVLKKHTRKYYNVEAEHHRSTIQKKMIDRLMRIIR